MFRTRFFIIICELPSITPHFAVFPVSRICNLFSRVSIFSPVYYAVLGYRTAPDVRRCVHMVAVLPVVTDCTACPAVQRAALIAAPHNTHFNLAFGVRCSFFRLALFRLSLAGLPLCFSHDGTSAARFPFSPSVPVHFFSCGFTVLFIAFCECCFVLAVCRSFG